MSVNKVIVIGNLGANPDIRALPSGQNVANFSLATTERFTDRNGGKQERTDWHQIVAFGPLADTCERFLRKGRQVYIEGRLTTRQYEAKDGSGKRYRTEIVAQRLRLLGNRLNPPEAQRLRPPTTTFPFSSHPPRESRESGSPAISLNVNRRLRKMDIYAIVTEKIINLLESGVILWRRPWSSTGLPRNLVSKKPYRGINYFLLSASKYVSPFWLTMRQANELGGHVRKSEESTIVLFWKVDDAKRSTEDLDNEKTDWKMRRRFLLRYYRVFDNLEQCELPPALLDELPKVETHQHDPIEAAERIIAGMPNPPEIQFAGSKAFYSSNTDRITLPPRELFTSAEEFYATAMHETVHYADFRIMPRFSFRPLRLMGHVGEMSA